MAKIKKPNWVYKEMMKEMREAGKDPDSHFKDHHHFDYDLRKTFTRGQKAAISKAYNDLAEVRPSANYFPIDKERGEKPEAYWDRVKETNETLSQPLFRQGFYLDTKPDVEWELRDTDLVSSPEAGMEQRLIRIDREEFNTNTREYMEKLLKEYNPVEVNMYHEHWRGKGRGVDWDDYEGFILDCIEFAEEYADNKHALTGFLMSFY